MTRASSIRTHQRAKYPAGFTLVEMLVVIAIIGILMAMLLPAISAARATAQSAACKAHLADITKAIVQYADTQGHFPSMHYGRPYNRNRPSRIARSDFEGKNTSGGLKWMGWEIAIQPFMGGKQYVDSVDRTLNSINDSKSLDAKENFNAQILRDRNGDPTVIPENFRCPSAPEQTEKVRMGSENLEFATMNYAAVMGIVYDDSGRVDTAKFDPACGSYGYNGIIFPGGDVLQNDISDGPDNTFILGERLYLTRHWLTSYWAKGDQLCVYNAKNMKYPVNTRPEENPQGNYPDLFNSQKIAGRYDIGYSPGTSFFDPDRPSDAQNKNQSNFNDLPFASRHPGGANFAFAGTSVSFVSEFTELPVLMAMATRNGGQAQIGDRREPELQSMLPR